MTSIRPTRRAVALAGGALLLFGVGTNVQAGWVLAVAALLIGMLVAGILLPLRGLRGVTVTRMAPQTAVAGQSVPMTLAVSNSSRASRALFRVSDDFLGRAYAVVGNLGPGQDRTYEADRTGARRGVYASGPCELETGAPFGVMRARRMLVVDSPVVVYPKTYSAHAWVSRGPAGWPAPSSMGDVSSVRDYRPGDPLRHIHWRSVARKGHLVVREFDREAQATMAVAAAVGDDADVADAVASVACSIAIAGLREGEVALGGRRVRTAEAVLGWGARLEPGDRVDLDGIDRADAVVYVGPAVHAPLDDIASFASSSSISAVLIDAEADLEIVGRLRGIGGTVAVVRPGEIERWFESGCPAS